MRPRRVWAAVCCVLLIAGCAVRLGGPSPEEFDAAAVQVPAPVTAEQLAAALQQQGVEFALVSSPRDSAWFADAAARANLKTSRPGAAGSTTFAFLGREAVGDTTLSLAISSGGELRVHDALYRIDRSRMLDLMSVRFDQSVNLRDAMRTLLEYVATDVMANAAVLLAIEPPTPALGDSVSVVMRAIFADTWECTPAGRRGDPAGELPVRLFYGPAVRITCESAERVRTPGNGLVGRFVIR